MSARLFSAVVVPREVVLLDESTWDVPAWLSPEAWLIEAGLDGHRAVGGPDDPEDER
ncbi:hypothetical protein [uncultured Brevundimonas sp.]|uniref:hypothetical protein n=1 Tax=uncultured Brevundimonas sp. TaxID=213418 RepID=UPI0030EB6D30|tara:strand:- start:163157 stop:163327 length:171 start_codon:yes stop_codon:yes gene_type:complete